MHPASRRMGGKGRRGSGPPAPAASGAGTCGPFSFTGLLSDASVPSSPPAATMMSENESVDASPVQNLQAQYANLQRKYQSMLDKWTPYTLHRWLTMAGLLAVFMLRIVFAQGVRVLFIQMCAGAD